MNITILKSLRALIAPLLLLALCVAPATLQTSAAHADDNTRATVTMLLMAYDTFPSADDFKRVTDDPRAELLAIYNDPDTKRIVKLQAIDALALFPNKDVRALYQRILAMPFDGDAPNEVHRAINGLMQAFGKDAISDVAPMLDHSDVQLRLTAVHALGLRGEQEGVALMRIRMDKETHPVVREEIARRIATIR